MFWRGKDLEKKNPPWAAWDLLCRPKCKGGLDILKLQTQNTCLLMKMVHKFTNHLDIPWVKLIWEIYYPQGTANINQQTRSFWWWDCLKLMPIYRTWQVVNYRMGIYLLSGWIIGMIIRKKTFGHIFFLSPKTKTLISISSLESLNELITHFHLLLSEEAYIQYQELQQCLLSIFSIRSCNNVYL